MCRVLCAGLAWTLRVRCASCAPLRARVSLAHPVCYKRNVCDPFRCSRLAAAAAPACRPADAGAVPLPPLPPPPARRPRRRCRLPSPTIPSGFPRRRHHVVPVALLALVLFFLFLLRLLYPVLLVVLVAVSAAVAVSAQTPLPCAASTAAHMPTLALFIGARLCQPLARGCLWRLLGCLAHGRSSGARSGR